MQVTKEMSPEESGLTAKIYDFYPPYSQEPWVSHYEQESDRSLMQRII